jgi:tetratricopeptide (TPR) repeat protein
MPESLVDEAMELMRRQQYAEALDLFRRIIESEPAQWNVWYMAGQCCRFLDDIDGAIAHLARATDLNQNEPPAFLALGIAYQLNFQWDDAVEAFRRAVELDADYELAYNSLALTQKKSGELDKALHNYDAGVKALARRIVKGMQNKRDNPIIKHRDVEGALWTEYAMFGALYLTSVAQNVGAIAWPTGEQALDEERTERHGGLYWIDRPNEKGEMVRLFLPNYFNTFRESLAQDAAYANLIGNRGTVFEMLGRHDEAQQHFQEASEFMP